MKFISLISIFYCLVLFAHGQQLTGVVKAFDGKPVEAADIRPGYVKTDKDGKFKLENADWKFLIVSANDFRPVLKKLNGESEIEIILVRENQEDKLNLRECTQKREGKTVGVFLKSNVPKGFRSRKGRDIDYVDFYIFSDKNRENGLDGISGPQAGSGFPGPEWINSSNQISVRSISNGKRDIGWDFRGVTTGGKSWRYVRVFEDHIKYIVDSDEEKDIFDKIIDNSCSDVERVFKH